MKSHSKNIIKCKSKQTKNIRFVVFFFFFFLFGMSLTLFDVLVLALLASRLLFESHARAAKSEAIRQG